MKRYFINILWMAFLSIGTLLPWAPAQAQTVNLATHAPLAASAPANGVFEWHSAIPVSSTNKMTAAQVAAAAPGIYYGVYFFAADNCYSAPAPLRIVANTCAAPTVDIRQYVDSTNKPTGTFVSWHSATPVSTANRMTVASATAALPGTYFVSYYDAASNCFAGGSPIVVLGAVCGPDLTPVIRLTINSLNINETQDFVVRLNELLNIPTSSQIAFNITVPNGYVVTFAPAQTSSIVVLDQTYTVSNPSWNAFVNSSSDIDLQSKPGFVINGASNTVIGFKVKRTAAAITHSVGNIIVNIYADAARLYDSNNQNNLYTRIINAN